MSLQARDFFNIHWMNPIPGVAISFDERVNELGDEPVRAPTHSVELTVDVVGMQRELYGTMTVEWNEEEFAKANTADFANRVQSSIDDKLLPYVTIVGFVRINKL